MDFNKFKEIGRKVSYDLDREEVTQFIKCCSKEIGEIDKDDFIHFNKKLVILFYFFNKLITIGIVLAYLYKFHEEVQYILIAVAVYCLLIQFDKLIIRIHEYCHKMMYQKYNIKAEVQYKDEYAVTYNKEWYKLKRNSEIFIAIMPFIIIVLIPLISLIFIANKVVWSVLFVYCFFNYQGCVNDIAKIIDILSLFKKDEYIITPPYKQYEFCKFYYIKYNAHNK